MRSRQAQLRQSDFQFFANRIRQPRVAAIRHSHGGIVALYEGCRDMRGVRIADHWDKLAADALSGAISLLPFGCIGVNKVAHYLKWSGR